MVPHVEGLNREQERENGKHFRAIILGFILILGTDPAWGGVKRFVANGAPRSDWEVAEHWSPAGVPTANDTVIIDVANPYVSVSGDDCVAHTVIIKNGGRLVIRKQDNGEKLTVTHDIIVEPGGTFNTTGSGGSTGPILYIGGDVVNDGTWDLSGVSAGNAGVVFNGAGTQTISGSSPLVFQNLKNDPDDSLVVDGVSAVVLGTMSPAPDNGVCTVNGGEFSVGEAPLPITLAWFDATFSAAEGGVFVRWQTLSEVDNYGFFVERQREGSALFETQSFVPGAGQSLVPLTYEYLDRSAGAGRWIYRLRQMDRTGEEVVFEPRIVDIRGVTGVSETDLPGCFTLQQNYPNPFNPSTRIRFSVSASGRALVRVYNALGAEVATVFDGQAVSGRTYDTTFDASGLPGGAYFYRLEFGEQHATGRMLLVK